MSETKRRRTVVVAVITIVSMLLIGVALTSGPGSPRAGEDPTTSEQATDPLEVERELGLTRRDADDVTAMGEVDAPLVLIEYADYRCPFCGVFNRDTLPQIVEDYVDTGKVRIEWRDLPLFGEQSVDAAVAARAAGRQGLFWEYHTAVYADAPERGHLEVTDAKIRAWAEQVGVPDLKQFDTDRRDKTLRTQVEKDGNEGQRVGATGTPTFVVGNQRLVGAQPIETFREYLDQHLAAAGVE